MRDNYEKLFYVKRNFFAWKNILQSHGDYKNIEKNVISGGIVNIYKAG